ncbi:MAG: response regulator [Bacteroidales bacterium]
MKKLLIIVVAAIVIFITVNFLFYNSLYDKQISYIENLLDRQVRIVGLSVDKTDNGFESDLNQIIFSHEVPGFFSDNEQRTAIIERMKLFFSKHEDLVTGIKLYDNQRNEFTLKKDDRGKNWLEQNFVLHVQGAIMARDTIMNANRSYSYYLPLLLEGLPVGNIVVTTDFQRFFKRIFSEFSNADNQWQWIVSDSGDVIYDNSAKKVNYPKLTKITGAITAGTPGHLKQNAGSGGTSIEIISSYYPARLLKKNLGLVFSAPTGTFQKYIIRNSLLLMTAILLIFLVTIYYFWKYLRQQKSEFAQLKDSEKMLFRLIDEMPAGIIIHDAEGKILKANRAAAEQYSFTDESLMVGEVFHKQAATGATNYFSQHLGGIFSPEQFVIIPRGNSEIILFRTSIPVSFQRQNAIMEMLIDVTRLESARKEEARASMAKSDFLARMSYEIRTPLNGIIGMTDVLENKDLDDETRNVAGLLRRSSEVLMNIITDILDFSKIESGEMILDEVPFSLRQEIRYCLDLARTNIDESCVGLTFSIDEEVPDRVIGDSRRLRQILGNFIGHSIENTPRGRIDLRCTFAGREEGVIRLAFELTDTGRNFDSETIGKIFGNELNIGSKVYSEDDESGFGTVLARQLVELMGGTFTAESPSGPDGNSGLRIRFTIALNSNEIPSKNLNFGAITSFGAVKTLVITGSGVRDEGVLAILHKTGLVLTVTTFQKSTVSQIRANQNYISNRYHLVIILDDLEFDGFIAAEEIWENQLSNQFRMLIISQEDKKGNLLRCIKMGVDHYLVKPFEIEDLSEVLRSSFTQIGKRVPESKHETVRSDLHILIVEDNKMNQKVIGTMLKSLGYAFDFADDGLAGYIQARTRRYDVIFMDLLMPQMDGFEAARKILEHDPSLLIVAFTADNLPDSKQKAEMSGIREFIAKPIRIDDLKKFFNNHFAKN